MGENKWESAADIFFNPNHGPLPNYGAFMLKNPKP